MNKNPKTITGESNAPRIRATKAKVPYVGALARDRDKLRHMVGHEQTNFKRRRDGQVGGNMNDPYYPDYQCSLSDTWNPYWAVRGPACHYPVLVRASAYELAAQLNSAYRLGRGDAITELLIELN